MRGMPHPKNMAIPRAITIGISPASIHATIACPHPISCLVFIKYHCKMQPRQGITATIAIKSTVTITLPKSITGALTAFNPINRKIEPITSVNMNTSISNPTSPPNNNNGNIYVPPKE